MEDIKNNEVEVTTEVSGAEEMTQEILIPKSSSEEPSKGFVALVVGGIAAAVVGTVVAVKRHKKKKTDAEDPVEEYDQDFDDFYEEDDLDNNGEPAIQVVEGSKENSDNKKG